MPDGSIRTIQSNTFNNDYSTGFATNNVGNEFHSISSAQKQSNAGCRQH